MNPELSSSPELLIEEINKIEELVKNIRWYMKFKIFWVKNENHELQIELNETKTKLLKVLDNEWKYEELITELYESKKQILRTKWINNLSLLAESVDTMIPVWWLAAWGSVPFMLWDLYSQHKVKKQIEKIYQLIEKDETINLDLKHINPQSLALFALEVIETSFEALSPFLKLSFWLLVVKIIFIANNNKDLNNISKELDEINNYLLNKLQKK